jgi:septum site-determining protein MinD
VLLPAAQSRGKEAITREQMKDIVSRLSPDYDYIVIDCPAGIEMGFQNAIAPATEALIVTTPEVAAVRDADRVIGLLEANSITNTQLIVNRVKPEMIEANNMMSVEDILEILAIPLIGIVPDDEQIIVSSNRGEPLVLEEKLSVSGQTLNNIARRLGGEKVEFIDLAHSQENLLKRIRRWFSEP